MNLNPLANILPAAASRATDPSATDPAKATDDMFLKLLVAQLKSQSPLDPVDPTQFTSQLVQFNMLDQLTQINQALQSLSAASPASQTTFSSPKTTTIPGAH
jgi:flagellar basal-body rod modification protein FlgD